MLEHPVGVPFWYLFCTHEETAANYICPVWMRPCTLGAAVHGALSPDVEGSRVCPLRGVHREPARAPLANSCFRSMVGRRGRTGGPGCFWEAHGLGKAAHIAPKDETGYGSLAAGSKTH